MSYIIIDSDNIVKGIGEELKEYGTHFNLDGIKFNKTHSFVNKDSTGIEINKHKIINDEIIDNENYKKTKFTFNDFADMFKKEELRAIYEASKVNTDLEIFLDKVKAASYINTEDVRTIKGLGDLKDLEIISADTYNKIKGVGDDN